MGGSDASFSFANTIVNATVDGKPIIERGGLRRSNEVTQSAADAGLPPAACSRFRAGTRVPHPRYWDAFLAIVEGSGAR